MLVVLSMLVLFMLIGTAFLMTSSQSHEAAKGAAKLNRRGNHATRLLDRAVMVALRDTDDPHSAIRYHSLLRDLYGTDGFQGVVYSPLALNLGQPLGQVTRFAGATAGTAAEQLGPTQGQFIDIYVRSLAWDSVRNASLDDPLTLEPIRENQGTHALLQPDSRHVVKLERNILDLPQLHALPLTRGYYNGCLLTITSGPAVGQSARIVDYEYLADIGPNQTDPTPAIYTRLFRFRVMAFPRTDGQPLQIRSDRPPEIADLAGATFIVNGRPFNGTGVGYNPLAGTGAARLTALQLFELGADLLGTEVALTPNSAFLDFSRIAMCSTSASPFTGGLTAMDFLWLNDPDTSRVPLASRPQRWKYQSFAGPGDADESYDAADFQNMFLALQTVSPRSRGRVVHNNSDLPVTYEVDDLRIIRNGNFVSTDAFLRLDLEDVPWPSFHRPDLVNFWYHRILAYLVNDPPAGLGLDGQVAVQAIIHPYGRDAMRGNLDDPTGAPLEVRDFIVAIKRKVMLRPIREDHPNFDGSNTQSIPPNLMDDSEPLAIHLPPPTSQDPPNQIAIPYWEAVGPWDVDNDNDGINDSIWVDTGEPLIEAEDGTRYKALYAFLIVDLDSRLNVNAHGLVDDLHTPIIAPPNFDPTAVGLARDGVATFRTDQLPHGIGYGPADISLRPVFPFPWLDVNGTLPVVINRSEDSDGDRIHVPTADAPIDSYATLLIGRQKIDLEAVSGKYGFAPTSMAAGQAVTPGRNYLYVPNPDLPGGEQAVPDLAAQYKFFNYPWTGNRLPGPSGATISLTPPPPLSGYFTVPPSAFGTPPDLLGRYSLGIGHAGQPVYEVAYDVNPNTATLPPNQQLPVNLLNNSPYELELSNSQRRDTWALSPAPTAAFAQSLVQNDDAAFATTDLERVLRTWDADSGTLPSRLWDVVDAFDPVKLMEFDPFRVTAIASQLFNEPNPSEPQRLAAAQQITAINRHLVTTDSFDLPVPAASVPNPDVYAVGADGQPGRAGVDDDGDTQLDQADRDELNSPVSDDFRSLFGKEATQATAFDLLRFRVWLEVRKEVMRENGWDEAALAGLNQANYRDQLLTPVSARTEARLNGEPFADQNSNGIFDSGDTFTPAQHDTNGNGVYDPPMASLLAPELVAGKRMDLNRPFGDGRDSGDGLDNDGNGTIDELGEPGDLYLNGVVDEPFEAGDPFLDRNKNGKWDNAAVFPPNGEPFINIDGSVDSSGKATYTPPRDQLWRGLTTERIGFDHTNGQGEPLHPEVAKSAPGGNSAGGGFVVRNLDSHARQLYARHLYCLMLLLVDEGYIAPHDELDPQIQQYLDTTIANSTAANVLAALNALPTPPADPAQEARRIMLRKLTCRMIAQWAVNCVDMRDADAIMTPFEYDEYPWDGWGTLDTTDPAKPLLLPLDGDTATDENLGQFINWTAVAANPAVKAIADLTALSPARQLPTPLNQTRGVVWGAERPELLITETLAFHDRRAEDAMSSSSNGHADFGSARGTRYFDGDLDQGLRPWGRLYVELKNPWSEDGQRPLDLYSKIDSTQPPAAQLQASQGVELGRLTNYALDESKKSLSSSASAAGIKRSPVWRLIVVEEWPDSRNAKDVADDNPPDRALAPGFTQPKAYVEMRNRVEGWVPSAATPVAPFYAANPDFDEVFQLTDTKSLRNAPKRKPSGREMSFEVAYPYIEREFYFTTDNSTAAGAPLRDVTNANFKLRVPNRTIPAPTFAGTWPNRFQTQRFIAANPTNANNDYAIAPILPGRYGVVGSAGTKYTDGGGIVLPDSIKNSLVTPIGRVVPMSFTSSNQTEDKDNARALDRTRRILMRPSTDPNVNQFLVAGNGGFDPTDEPTLPPAADPTFPTLRRDKNAFEIGRSNELINVNGTVRNIQDTVDNDPIDPRNYDGDPDSEHYQPCVAIPVEGMSVSEPAWGWAPREWEARQEESQRHPSGLAPSHQFNPNFANGEGRYATSAIGAPGGAGFSSTSEEYYDVPFDLNRAELNRTGTTANYRTIHLQRLANPLLPWNPPPGQIKDATGADMHQPNLPINPYRTVDTSSVDLTAFNGVTDENGYPDEPPGMQRIDQQSLFGQFRPWIANERPAVPPGGFTTAGLTYRDLMEGKDPKKYPLQVWHFQSFERGSWDLLNLGGAPLLPPARSIWEQEPARVELRTADPTNGNKLTRILDGRSLATMRVAMSNNMETDQNHVPNTPPTMLKTALGIQKNRVDMVLEHSLGFGNESFGRLYSKQVPADQPPTVAAAGAPKNYEYTYAYKDTAGNPAVDETRISSTYPWLAWNNRPVVSAKEILQVPAASSAQMLRQYATINSRLSLATRPNPYDGAGVDTMNTPDPADDAPLAVAVRLGLFEAPFGHLLNMFATASLPARVFTDAAGNPVLDTNNNWQFVGAPHFYRILEYVRVPSRYVGTETSLNPDVFNDVPTYITATEPVGADINASNDPRYNFQPPFSRVSRERDPGRVNLNTVTGQRVPAGGSNPPQIWSDVFDGLMHRYRDGDLRDSSGNLLQYGHFGPAWRDVVLSRRGYIDPLTPLPLSNAPSPATTPTLVTSDRTSDNIYPDIAGSLLNSSSPTVFANPFRSPEAGDLVPLAGMLQPAVQAGLLRSHPYAPGDATTENAGWGSDIDDPATAIDERDDNFNGLIDDAREAGIRPPGTVAGKPLANDELVPSAESRIPLFSEAARNPFTDTDRNPYMMYQPMSRLENLVTNRSGVFAIWITVGYFEVEKAPNWSDNEEGVQDRCGGNTPESLALYNRIYPDGYRLGREVGSDTGDVKRARGFYIVDRTEEVGFKPGEDLNVERTIRLRRRIE